MRIGIDLGGTKIEGVALDDRGDIVWRDRVPTPRMSYTDTLQAITTLVRRIEQDLGCQATVGIATPGSCSPRTGLMKNCNSICLNQQPFVTDISDLLAREVRIANDADCFVLSEASDGAAQGCKTVFGVILGTGVGGGICLNGKLLHGPNGIAGEWGHNRVVFDTHGETRRCYCGRDNCLETWLSGPGLARSYALQIGKLKPDENSPPADTLTAKEIGKLLAQGNPDAVAVFASYAERLALSLSQVINILDPDVIVLGGGLSNLAGLYQEVPARWQPYVFNEEVLTRLVPAKYGDSSGVRGAAWLWPV